MVNAGHVRWRRSRCSRAGRRRRGCGSASASGMKAKVEGKFGPGSEDEVEHRPGSRGACVCSETGGERASEVERSHPPSRRLEAARQMQLVHTLERSPISRYKNRRAAAASAAPHTASDRVSGEMRNLASLSRVWRIGRSAGPALPSAAPRHSHTGRHGMPLPSADLIKAQDNEQHFSRADVDQARSSSPGIPRTIADSDVGRRAHSLASQVFLTSMWVACTAAMTISMPSELGRDVMAISSQMRGSLFVLRSGRASNPARRLHFQSDGFSIKTS